MLLRCKDPTLRSLHVECLIRLVRFVSNNSMFPHDISRAINIVMHSVMTLGMCTRGRQINK